MVDAPPDAVPSREQLVAQLWVAQQELAFAIVEREAAKYQLRLLEDAIDRLILARHAALCAREGTPS